VPIVITDALCQFGIGVASTVVGWFPPQPAVTGVVVTAGNYLQPIMDGAGSMGVWVPWPVIAACLLVVVPCFLASFLFKAARAVAAHIPLVGGAG